MQLHRNLQLGCLLLTVAGSGTLAMGSLAFADSVPESIRIQERAEKAYETAPVVPIERGNAHHRDLLKDEGDGGGAGYESTPASPPRAEQRHDTNR